ncbi:MULTISPECIES: Tn3 family transposase [Lysobacteraceae]|uniref:Tn3 family transposase n=1 Tax=Pseudoxanthomonas kaohsiungensis TaxID=283923 RepID=A0ABW3LXP3_9GAMM|nr:MULTISPECIES: Tn3 family transposase [Xanthomonadaceae]KAF1702854.1 Tn3 family transposase [Pseudoxanthomonas kaohsiungensis]UXB22262.1 Tn3 family transposase [Stenotrophomonas maltophilia]
MTTLHETAYPRLKPDPTAKELQDIYTPSEAELQCVRSITSGPATRLALLLHLKLFQRLGYFTTLDEVPQRIAQHVAQAVGMRRVPADRLASYDTSGGKRGHLAQLRAFLNVRPLDSAGRDWLGTVAETAAQTKHIVPDIVNVMLEELVHHRFELPAFSTLERLAIAAREQVHDAHYRQITDALTPAMRALIDELLLTPPGSHHSGWHALKREPKRPTNKEVRHYLQHIQRLRTLAEQLPPIDVSVPKLKQFRAMARALDASELAELVPVKRYALAAIFIRSQYRKTLDDAADLFIRLIQNLENTAQQKLIAYQLEHSKRADALIGQLREILQAYQVEGTDTQRVDAIEGVLVADISLLMAECDEHMAYAGRNYLPFLLAPYGTLRPLLFNCLEIMGLRAASQDPSMEHMIGAVLALRSQRREAVDAAGLGLEVTTDLTWLSAAWRKHVLPKALAAASPGWIHRKYFELAVLAQVKDELKSGDLYIPHGERYDDYREQLVDEATFAQELDAYGEVSGIATDAADFVQGLRTELTTLADAVDARFPDNLHASVVDGRLVLRRLQGAQVTQAIAAVDSAITERLPPTSIVDVLVDTTRWLDLHVHFRPIAGTDARVDDLLRRVITTLFCYGCNLGPTQTARSVKGFSRRQISWLNLKYVTDETLDKAIVEVINLYNKFELPGYWGSGKSASADGTKWSVYEQNLLSEYHIRYGGYGGIGYYHVSDKYIALFSHFIPCGVHEAVYILDGLLANRSDIQPDTVHGDTQAQSFPVFGLAHLLGINLMPRIRNIKDLVFSRPEPGRTYENIQALFGDSIDWKLIETHLHDMLRVAISIKVGKITASTILRRLGTYSRKNKLYWAFRELGKAVRTLFLLRYIDDVEVRKTIHAATNKSEEFNGFVKWAFFGGEGIIAENVQHEQRKIVRYNQLVANLVILHNVEQMTRVLAELRQDGANISPEVLAGLSPYRTSHINRFGDYTLDLKREVEPIDFSRRILEFTAGHTA